MTLGILVGNVIKITAMTLISETAMRAIEQKDYGRWIRFTGVSAVAVEIVKYYHYIEKNPPLLVTLTKESLKGWKDFFKSIGLGGK